MQKNQSTAQPKQVPPFFENIPGMKEIFSKGPLKQQTDTDKECVNCDDGDCTDCQLTDAYAALSTCGKSFERASCLIELVRDLSAGPVTAQDKRRVFFLCEEIQNILTEGQAAIDGAGIE